MTGINTKTNKVNKSINATKSNNSNSNDNYNKNVKKFSLLNNIPRKSTILRKESLVNTINNNITSSSINTLTSKPIPNIKATNLLFKSIKESHYTKTDSSSNNTNNTNNTINNLNEKKISLNNINNISIDPTLKNNNNSKNNEGIDII